MQQQKINDILTFLQRSKNLESVERYGSSLRGKQNTVAEHSWRLGLMTLVVGLEYGGALDMSRALSLALIHDIAEAKTGDIDAYAQIAGGAQTIKDKAQSEESAMLGMTGDLSFGDRIYGLWREYEEQVTVEAKFVRALDKIEGFLHIAEGGVAAYIPKEFHADYANAAVAAFDEAVRELPGLIDFLDAVKKDLRKQFEEAGVEWIDEAVKMSAVPAGE